MTTPAPCPASSEETKHVERSGPSRKTIIGWGVGMLAALGTAWLVGAVGYPRYRDWKAVQDLVEGVEAIPGGGENPEFTRTLRRITGPRKGGTENGFFWRKGRMCYGRKGSWTWLFQSSAQRVRSSARDYVLIVLEPTSSIPGYSVRYLILVDRYGKLLDEAGFETSTRRGVVTMKLTDGSTDAPALVVVSLIQRRGSPVNTVMQIEDGQFVNVAGEATRTQ